jgi:tetratricopeptide (TPR) repeat protein
LVPIGQSVDHDYSPSLTIFQHGAILWILLLAALVFAAIRLHRRYLIGCFGLFWFLIALAPTSSVIPISDPLVERRMYLAIVGLILVGFELFQHMRVSRPAAWGILTTGTLILGGFCYARNQTWSDPEKLFADAAAQSTHNPRPYINLTEVLVHKNRCDAAIPPLRRAEHLLPGSYPVEVAWGWTLQCLGQREQAMQRLQSAARIRPNSRVYEWIGLLYGEMNRSEEAGRALHTAVDLDPGSVSAHKALALWYESVANLEAASAEYTRSLKLDPRDREAKLALARLRQPPRSFQN